MSDSSIYDESPGLWGNGSDEESAQVVPPTPPQHEQTRLLSSFDHSGPSQIFSTDDEDDAQQHESNDDEQKQYNNEQIEKENQEIQDEQSEYELEEDLQETDSDDIVNNNGQNKADYNIDEFENNLEDDLDEEQDEILYNQQDEEQDDEREIEQDSDNDLDDESENEEEEQSDEAENIKSMEEPDEERPEETSKEQPEESASVGTNNSESEEVTVISSDNEEARSEIQYEDSGSEYVDEENSYKQSIRPHFAQSDDDRDDSIDDNEEKAFHYASTPASRYAFKRPSKEAQRLINYLNTTHADDLSTHLYSTHLLHRINPQLPKSTWTAWPSRHAVFTPTLNTPTVPRPIDLERLDVDRKLDAQLRGNNNSSNNVKHNGAGGDNDEGFVRQLPKFDSCIAAVTGNLTASDQSVRYPVSEYKSSIVYGSTLGHGGGTKYTSTTGRPQEMPYNSVSQGIPPFDFTRYRQTAEEISDERCNAFEHARKLVMFEISAAFERIVRQRIQEENKQQAQLDEELEVPPQKRRRLVINPDIDFKIPQQALARTIDTVDRVLMNAVAIQRKRGDHKPEDWITVTQNDAAVGSVFARCKKLFMDDIDDPRDSDSDDEEKVEGKEKQHSHKRKIKTKIENEKLPQVQEPKIISARLNFKTLNRINNFSLGIPPNSFLRPEITSFEPDQHAVNGFAYSDLNLMQTSINPIYTCGLQSTTKLKPNKPLEDYQPDDMTFYNTIDNVAEWRATPHARRLRLAYENIGRYAQPLDGYNGGGSSTFGTGRSYDQNWILEEYTPDLMSRSVFDAHIHFTQLEADRQHGRSAVLRHAQALRRLRRSGGGGRRFLKRAGLSMLYRKWKHKCLKWRRRQLRELRKERAAAATEPDQAEADDLDEDVKCDVDDNQSSDGEVPRLVQALNSEVFQKMAVSARTPIMAPRKYVRRQLGLW